MEQSGKEDPREHHHLFPTHNDDTLYNGVVRKIDCSNIIHELTAIPSPANPHSLGVGLLNQSSLTTSDPLKTDSFYPLVVNMTDINHLKKHLQTTTYSLTFYVTVAVGCSLIFLNILILLIICYQKNNKRNEQTQFKEAEKHSEKPEVTSTRTCVTFADTCDVKPPRTKAKETPAPPTSPAEPIKSAPIKSIYKQPNGSPHLLLSSVPDPPNVSQQRLLSTIPESSTLPNTKRRRDSNYSLRSHEMHEMRV